MKHSYVIGLQRYWWVFGSSFLVDSPHPPKSVQSDKAENAHACAKTGNFESP